jgi:hypothetical protein
MVGVTGEGGPGERLCARTEVVTEGGGAGEEA